MRVPPAVPERVVLVGRVRPAALAVASAPVGFWASAVEQEAALAARAGEGLTVYRWRRCVGPSGLNGLDELNVQNGPNGPNAPTEPTGLWTAVA